MTKVSEFLPQVLIVSGSRLKAGSVIGEGDGRLVDSNR